MYRRPPPRSAPVSDQQLIDEVRYLHALWRQGPPPPRPGQPRRPPTPPTPNQWPANPPPPDSSAPITWETSKTPSGKTHARAFTEEELAQASAAQTQKQAVQFCRDHFADGDEAGEDLEEVDEDDEEEMEDGFLKFFLSMFEKDGELAEVYQKGWENGEFVCLVCAGTGARVWKKFPNLVALVQHSLTISNTKRRFAHRAFGRAVCQILGWDADRLPSITPPADNKEVEVEDEDDGEEEDDDGEEEDDDDEDEDEDEDEDVEFEI